MYGNAPSHAAKTTAQFLTLLGFVTKTLTVCPPKPPDLNPIESLWSMIKRHVYVSDKQYSSNLKMMCGMSMAIETSPTSNPKSTIEKRIDSVNDRLFELIKGHGAHGNKSTFFYRIEVHTVTCL